MADDPEKKFHSIMEKLFSSSSSSPISNPSTSSYGGRKRPNPESALALVEPNKTKGRPSPVDAPLCRPWDRGDLMRRAATFKSMTWFAKPKAASAVNCARRGWINLDMDIIGCEACGARLLLSTPSSWSQQQVEKAALVFSLKLDSGHKLLCPWIDNACDERLAEFPPTPPPVLVNKFNERSSALLQLSALPVISSAALEYMKCAQLEEFLKQPPRIDYGNGYIRITQSELEPLENERGADSANVYYQAQKLISLCGWEPRSLPYVVDCKDRQKEMVTNVNILNSSGVITGAQNTNIGLCSVTANESLERTDCHSLNGLQADPQSIVLDCKLCGASVGLWTYSTVPRPVEFFRLVGYTELNTKKNHGQDLGYENNLDEKGAVVNSAANGSLSPMDSPSNLKLTIAGGPPPTKQNFKATISLPVIGRNLRARLSSDYNFRDLTFNDQDPPSESHNNNLLLEEKEATENSLVEQVFQPEAVEMLNSKTLDHGQGANASGDQSSSLCPESGEKYSAIRNESDIYMSLEGMDFIVEGNLEETGKQYSNVEFPTETRQDAAQDFDKSSKIPENSEFGASLDSPVKSFDSSLLRKSAATNSGPNVCTGNEHNKNNSLAVLTSGSCDQQQVLGTNVTFREDIARKIDSKKGENHPNTRNSSTPHAQSRESIKGGMQTPVNSGIIPYGTGKEVKQQVESMMEFDPIRQHRHFCPWIASTDGGAAGWQQTLSALFRQKDQASPSMESPPSTSKIKVDDPIASVRKLFRSPSSVKRLKPTHGSS